ncbi:MAG TPA: DUF1292 domain-containing protein [Bacillales bacterium]|nr:DUF1292 domain-containing protein [Bacillales bacterium]
MGDNEKERFVIEHEGEEHLFEELFRFTVEQTGASYIVLIPAENGSERDEEEVEVFAFRFKEGEGDSGEISFFPIETDEEWDMVEEMLHTFTEEEGE